METIRSTLGDTDQTCPPGGCPEGVVIRQTSNYGESDSGGKYEYLLPAVARKYNISVSSERNPDVSFVLKDYEVKGNETEIKLDFHLSTSKKPFSTALPLWWALVFAVFFCLMVVVLGVFRGSRLKLREQTTTP